MRKIIKGALVALVILCGSVVYYNYQAQDRMIFRTKVLSDDYTFDFNSPHKELYIPVNKTEKINAIYFPTQKKAKGVILYLHGSGNNIAFYGKRAGQYTKYGYDLLMVDYRGYGKSRATGFSEANLYEDAVAAYNYLLERFPEEQIVVYGQSLGTPMATWVAAHHNPKMLLLECPFYSMVDAAAYTKPFLPEWLIKLILRYHMRTDQFVQEVKAPIYIFHGTKDVIVPYTQAQKLYNDIADRKETGLFTFQDWGHEHFHKLDSYHKHLESLL